MLCLVHPATPVAAGSASPGPEGWLPKPQPTRGLGSLRERCRGGEEQARTVQSTDKMGMGCASWGPMALGALPLCIWGPGLPQNGASFLWGRAEPGVGGEPQIGMGTCSEMLADHRFCQRSSRPGLWGDVSQPQGCFWTKIPLYPWPHSAEGGCMDEGKDREKNKRCVCGCKTYTPGILHEIQDNLSLEAFGGVQWTEAWMRTKRTELACGSA